VSGIVSRAGGRRGLRARTRPGGSVVILGCGVLIVLVFFCAITGTLLAPHDPAAQNLLLGTSGPSGAHLLGTDDSGRDMLSRVIAGSRTAVVGPLVIAVGAGLLGTFFGLNAGYRGGWIDAAIMRAADVAYSLPGLLVAIVLLGVLGGGYFVAVAVLLVLTAPYDTRLIRGATLAQRGLPYVDAARTMGLSSRRIMFRHIWPNLLPLILANSFLNFAFSLVSLSALSFLGLGSGPGSADWGRMLSDNLSLLNQAPLTVIAPGIALVLTATSMNLLGDRLYELMSDSGKGR
jgi:peptide/nickel transport system permease protein